MKTIVDSPGRPRAHHRLTCTALATAIVSLITVPAMGQTPAAAAKPAAAKSWTPPRTAWGDPDLQGTWPGTPMMGVPLQRPTELAERRLLTDAEFAAREEAADRQARADREELATPRAPVALRATPADPATGESAVNHNGRRRSSSIRRTEECRA